jgi:solute carrier family 25 S-adenosylmethionine transporter 26
MLSEYPRPGAISSLPDSPIAGILEHVQQGQNHFQQLSHLPVAAAPQDGPQGFFRGYLAFLARDLPFDAIEFVSYEQLRILYLVRFA